MWSFRALVTPVATTLLVCVPLALSRAAPAEEAIRFDGRRLQGELTQDRDGRLRFLPVDKSPPLLLEHLQQVRFFPQDQPPDAASTPQRLTLHGDQWLTGRLLGLTAQHATWQTAWGERLALPRDALAAVTPTPGFAPVFEDDFETDLRAWTVTGMPVLNDRWHVSGKRSLVLAAPEQAVAYTLTASLEAGRMEIRFHDPGERKSSGCRIDMEFQTSTAPRTLRFQPVRDGEAYEVEGPEGPGVRQLLRRSRGWHRLRTEFSPRMLLITLDGAALWHSRRQGPGGQLQRVRLTVLPLAAGEAAAEMAFDDFRLARSVEELPHQREDAGQDEVWLLSGDQLFGSVRAADSRTLGLQGRYGQRTIPWPEIRGLYLRQEIPPPRITQSEHVRVWLRSESGSPPDQLEGAVRLLDKTRLVLQHAALGELALDRGHLGALRWVFHGRRIELDNGFHHLGQRVVPTLDVPKPEGLSLRRSFRLEVVPEQVYLVVEVTQLKGPSDGVAQALARGERCTQVLVNEKPVGYLNRSIERSSNLPQRLSLAVARSVLRVGENSVVLRQTPDPNTGSYEDCGVARLAIEVRR